MADSGALLQDGDGNVYFIPNQDLAGYQVSAETQQAVNANLEQLDSEVSGFASSRFQLRPEIKELRAFSGPVGWKIATPDDDTATVVQT